MRISSYYLHRNQDGKVEEGCFIVRSSANVFANQAAIYLDDSLDAAVVTNRVIPRNPASLGRSVNLLWEESLSMNIIENRNYRTVRGLKIALKRSLRKILVRI